VTPKRDAFLAATVRQAFATHRRNWGAITVAALITLVPAAVVQGLLASAAEDVESPVAAAALGAVAVGAGLLGYFVLSGVIAQIVLARRRAAGRARFLNIARSLPYAALLVVDLTIAAVTAIGLELLIVPGVVFATWFALAPALIETRHLRPAAALRRSRALVRGRFSQVLGLVTATLVVASTLGIAFAFLVRSLLAAPDAADLAIASLAASLVVKPITAVVTVELAIELDEVEGRTGGRNVCSTLLPHR
jgi:hypothetical protein